MDLALGTNNNEFFTLITGKLIHGKNLNWKYELTGAVLSDKPLRWVGQYCYLHLKNKEMESWSSKQITGVTRVTQLSLADKALAPSTTKAVQKESSVMFCRRPRWKTGTLLTASLIVALVLVGLKTKSSRESSILTHLTSWQHLFCCLAPILPDESLLEKNGV